MHCSFQNVHAAAEIISVPSTGATASFPCGPMSSNPFWSEACKHAQQKPLQTVQDANTASCGAIVRRLCTATADPDSLLLSHLLRCMFPALLCDLTHFGADCCVLHERSGGRDNVLSVAADGRGRSAACVAAVRMVQRADDVWQLRRRRDMGGEDGFLHEFPRKRRCNSERQVS